MDQYSYLLIPAREGNIEYHGGELGEELGWFLASREPSGRLPHIWPAQLPNQPEEASNKHRVDQKTRMGPLTLPATRIRCMYGSMFDDEEMKPSSSKPLGYR